MTCGVLLKQSLETHALAPFLSSRGRCLSDVVACDFCEGERCSGHGACAAGACECEDGYHGVFCGNPPDCRGIADSNGVCCEGVLDKQERCCTGANPKLDARGECCPSGSLDIVGTCDGTVALVDITGALCSTVMDAQQRRRHALDFSRLIGCRFLSA
eukprot:1181838-Prorocentrum_minimum.AAC.5